MDHASSDDDENDEFFDCIDFSDDDEQTTDEYVNEPTVEFKPFNIWNNSEDNLVEYTLPPNFGKKYIFSI